MPIESSFMRRKLDVCLYDVRTFAAQIVDWTRDKTLEGYSSDPLLKYAVERLFTLLGESLVRTRQYFPESFDRIQDAVEVVRFRNRLVHLYDLMKDEEVWRVVQDELPTMIKQVDEMISGAQA